MARDRTTATNDDVSLTFDRISNTVTAVWEDGNNGAHTFAVYDLNAVGGGITPSLSLVKYQVESEGGLNNANFPRIASTSLTAIPEPAVWVPLGLGLAALAFWKRRGRGAAGARPKWRAPGPSAP